jgi:hypothetical protein
LIRTVASVFILPAALFGAFLFKVDALSPTGSLVSGVAFGLLFGLLFPPTFQAVFARQIVRLQRARAPAQAILVNDDGVERTFAGTAIRHPWSDITRVVELPSAFILFAGTAAVGSIEKTAIPSVADLSALRAFLSAVRPLSARPSTFLALEASREPQA